MPSAHEDGILRPLERSFAREAYAFREVVAVPKEGEMKGLSEVFNRLEQLERTIEADVSNDRRAFSAGKRGNQNQPPSRSTPPSPAGSGPQSFNSPSIPAAPASPSLTNTMTVNMEAHQANQAQGRTPIFFREGYDGFIVKGNFMTLAAKPLLVEEGEWMAHQTVEQQRLLSGMLRCVQEPDKSTGRPTCNDQTCPAMTAGTNNFTWIDTKGNPINIPAPQYIKHIQTWVNGKIIDPSLFPTETFTSAPPLPTKDSTAADPTHYLGKTSGFPQRFETEVRNMFKQMFRCYAHLYWQHWLFFYETNAHRELNTCFVHFMNVARLYNLLGETDVQPMAPLIERWVAAGSLPKVEKVGEDATRTPATAATAPA